MTRKHLLYGLVALALAVPAVSQGHDHGEAGHGDASPQAAATHDPEASATTTVKGEVVDLVCYLDHEARGPKHADCAKTCIESGLPVGLKAEDGTLYLLVGQHKPLNHILAPLAAKTITVRGKVATRDGVHLLENVEIVTP